MAAIEWKGEIIKEWKLRITDELASIFSMDTIAYPILT